MLVNTHFLKRLKYWLSLALNEGVKVLLQLLHLYLLKPDFDFPQEIETDLQRGQ
jgi:hypothetical protein